MTAGRATAIAAALALLVAVFLPKACARAPAATSASSSSSSAADQVRTASAAEDHQERRGPVTTRTHSETRRPDGTVIVRELERLEAPIESSSSSSSSSVTFDHQAAASATEQRTTPGSPPAPPPRWSVSLALDNAGDVVRHQATPAPRIFAGARVIGPAWIEASAAPFRGELGAGVGLDVSPTLAAHVHVGNLAGVVLRQEAPDLRAGVSLELLRPLRLLASATTHGELGIGISLRW